MSSADFEQLEAELRTLGENKGILSISKKQAIRDRVFQSIGQIELADAIASGETKADLAVSLKHLRQAMIPHRLSFSMPVTVSVVIMVFLGSIITGAAAQSSKPGDVLFTMRKVLENLEMAVVTNPVKKAEFSLNIADQRMKDLEASVGQEEALHTVLKETQLALTSAKDTIKKAQDSGDTAGSTALLDKFNALLNDQKIILEDIEATKPSDDVIKTIVAIRDAITPKDETKPTEGEATTVKPTKPAEVALPTKGLVTLSGSIGTYTAKPVLLVGAARYFLIGTQIDLIPYMGSGRATVTGYLQDGAITLGRVIIDGKVITDTEIIVAPTTDGSNTEKPAVSAKTE